MKNNRKEVIAVVIIGVLGITAACGFAGDQVFSRLNSECQTELSPAGKGPWTVVKPGDAFAGYTVLSVPSEGEDGTWTVLETENDTSGQFVYVGAEGVAARIKKVFGKIGKQVPTEVIEKPAEYWQSIFEAEDDVLGKQYLKESGDPSLKRTRTFMPPLLYPESYVGMKEYPYEVQVSWDGSIGVDNGFFTGMEGGHFPAALPFALNGKEIDQAESLQMLRGQLEHYLPIIHYVYQRKGEQVGWEQIILMGKIDGKPGLFLRFRLANFSAKAKPVTFAVHAPSGGRLEPTKDNNTLGIVAPFPKRYFYFKPEKEEFRAALVSDQPFSMEKDVPTWSFQLAPGQHQDLYLFLPGHTKSGALSLKPEDIRCAFYRALLGQYRGWQDVFNRGVQFTIPEPLVNEIYKGTLAKVLVCVDGNGPRGGASHYDGFWAFCNIYTSQVLLETGHYEEARRYLQHFIKTRIAPTGRFRMGKNLQMFDVGDFLQLVADYYWYTRDASLITENQATLDAVVGFARQVRQKSIDKFPPDDPRHGLVEGIMNNDWSTFKPDYFYTNDAPIWEGLRDYAQALQELGAAIKKQEYVDKGKELAVYADQYYDNLRRSFRTAIERDGRGRISYILIRPAPEGSYGQLKSHSTGDMRYRTNRRFHEWPRFIGTSFLTNEERQFFFDYEFNHEQTILGVRRFLPQISENFQIYNSAFQKLRHGMVREFLMEYYGHIHLLIAPGTWSGFEQVRVLPVKGEKGRRTGRGTYSKQTRFCGYEGAHATWPVARLTKQIFAFDEPGGAAVWVGRGIPRHWLDDGRTVSAKGIPTRYGKLDLDFVYHAASRTLQVDIDPIQRRMIPELRIGIRDPQGGTAVSVNCDPPGKNCKLNTERDLAIVEEICKPISLRINYE